MFLDGMMDSFLVFWISKKKNNFVILGLAKWRRGEILLKIGLASLDLVGLKKEITQDRYMLTC